MGGGELEDSPGSRVAKAIGKRKGRREGRVGPERPDQPRSPGFLSLFPPRCSSFPGPLQVKACDPPPQSGSQRLSAGLSSSCLALVSSSASRPGLSVGGAPGAPPPRRSIGGKVSIRRGLAG